MASLRLDTIILPEIKGDAFYYLIQDLSQKEKIETVLEIGSSCGDGSTEAIVNGLSNNYNGAPQLFCLEVSVTRFEKLVEAYKDKPFVHCYNTSSVPLHGFSTAEEVKKFYHEENSIINIFPIELVLSWLEKDIKYVKDMNMNENGIERIKRENNIKYFSMVLIDGSEFTGRHELDSVYGANILLLDDIRGFKNYHNYKRLIRDPNYYLISQDWRVRNGYAAFSRVDGRGRVKEKN